MNRLHCARPVRLLSMGLVLALGAPLFTACATTGSGRSSSASEAAGPTDSQRRARMHYEVGLDRMREGRTPEAIGELLQAIRLEPNDAHMRLALAESYRRAGRYAEAEQHLKAALQIDPDFQEAHLNLSALYVQLERYQDSIVHSQRLIDDPTFPQPWRALTNLGWAELQLGQIDQAAQHLQFALDYKDDYWPARLNLGILEAKRGRPTQAIQHFERVLEAKPGPYAEAEVRYRLAEQYESLGDRRSAIQQLTRAVDLRPSGPWSKRSAEYLRTLQ